MPLITQTIDDNPCVLVISHKHLLCNKIVDNFKQRNLKVLTLSPQNVTAKVIKEIQDNYLYKIVFIYGFSQINKKEYNKVLQILKNVQTPKVVITSLITRVKSNKKEFSKWKEKHNNQSEFIKEVQKTLNRETIIIGHDVLGCFADRVEYPFEFFLLKKQNNFILDPKVDLSLQSMKSFAERAANYFFKPIQQKVLIKGQTITSLLVAEQIQELIKQYYNKYYSIQDYQVQVDHKIAIDNQVIINNVSVSSVIDDFIRKLPALKIDNLFSESKDAKKTQHEKDQQKQPQIKTQKKSLKQQVAEPDFNLKPIKPRKIRPVKIPKQTFVKVKSEIGIVEKKNIKKQKIIKPINLPKNNEKDIKRVEKSTQEKQVTTISKVSSENDKKFDDLDKKLIDIFNVKNLDQKKKVLSERSKVESITKKKNVRKKIVLLSGFLFVFIGMLVFGLLAVFKGSVYLNEKILLSELESIHQNTQVENNWFNKFINFIVDKQVYVYSKIFDETNFYNNLLVNDLNKKIEKTQQLEQRYRQLSQEIVVGLFKGQKTDFKMNNNELISLNSKLYENWSYIKAEIQKAGAYSLFENQNKIDEIEKDYDQIIQQIENKRRKLVLVKQINPIFGQFLGLEKPQKYLVMLQNNLDLKPAGGLIQAFGVLDVDKGELISFEVYSVQEIEEMLYGKVEAPKEIETLMGTKFWKVRDTNWEADFGANANKINWFVQEALNVEFDGFIALNYKVVEEWLNNNQEIALKDLNLKLNADNLYSQLETFARKNDREIVQQGLVDKAIMQKIFTVTREKISNQQASDLVSLIYNQLEKKQLFVYLFDDNQNEIFNTLVWSGALVEPSCPLEFNQQNCLVDNIYQVETNIEDNRIEKYIERQVFHEVELQNNLINHKRIINYKNTAQLDEWPLGDYKFYLRFYVNDQASLKNIKIDGKVLEDKNIVKLRKNNQLIYATLITVGSKEEKTVELNYEMDKDLDEKYSYLFFNQLQPGMNEYPIQINVKYDQKLNPKVIAPEAEIEDNTIIFSKQLQEHYFVGVGF